MVGVHLDAGFKCRKCVAIAEGQETTIMLRNDMKVYVKWSSRTESKQLKGSCYVLNTTQANACKKNK